MSRELSESREQSERAARELERALQERDDALAQADALRPDAQSYVLLKERAAGVELEAHRRAQAVQEKAEEDAKRLRRQTQQWFQRMEREYDALRSQVETTVSHAASELEKAGVCLDKVAQLMGEREIALEGLSRAYDSTDPNRVEAPMPLSEE